ncbi:MAG: hypothetical protein RLZZ350_855 [Verrucomicrobiota bacterium]|jgi:hypothetical protein
MFKPLVTWFLAASAFAATANGNTNTLIIAAPELAHLNFSNSTGGLRVADGLETFTIIRANQENPAAADGRGWTYQHHPDLAAWHGRLYVGWNSCERDEDVWPSRELISSSTNGRVWTPPVEMFPQGSSTPLRMFFFLAPNGRMLVIAGLRVNHDKLVEKNKGPLLVRELRADHKLGEIFTLRAPAITVTNQPPAFEAAADKTFVAACRQLLADKIYLQQQDYGVLLDEPERMKWFNLTNWVANEYELKAAEDFGKAQCFFTRKDGVLVGVSKKRWVTLSRDGGATWTQPVRPPSLLTGMGKVWGQQLSNGRYALVYNPDAARRWPLTLLTSDDGVTFSHPVALHGELAPKRYEGSGKSPGASYHRGLSHWNDDGSWPDSALWLVYSLNKEEIRVIRVPVKK